MAAFYFFRVYIAELNDQGHDSDKWLDFDTTFIVAGSDVTSQAHDVTSEQDGRNELVKITSFKRFVALVDNSATIHTLHTLCLLEQKKKAAGTEIEFYRWDDKVKPDKQGNASLISLATVLTRSKITGHRVPGDEDSYWFYFELGAAEFNDQPDRKAK